MTGRAIAAMALVVLAGALRADDFNYTLLSTGGPGVATFPAPVGEFGVGLVARAPSGIYRVTFAGPDKVERTLELPLPPESLLNAPAPEGACGPLHTLIQELLRATDETVAFARSQDLFHADQAACPHLKGNIAAAMSWTQFRFPERYDLGPGETLQMTVERLDAKRESVLRRWATLLKGQTRPSSLEWPYHTEEEWLVGEVTRDIAEMVLYAKRRGLPAAADLAFTVTRAEHPSGGAPAYEVTLNPEGPAPSRTRS